MIQCTNPMQPVQYWMSASTNCPRTAATMMGMIWSPFQRSNPQQRLMTAPPPSNRLGKRTLSSDLSLPRDRQVSGSGKPRVEGRLSGAMVPVKAFPFEFPFKHSFDKDISVFPNFFCRHGFLSTLSVLRMASRGSDVSRRPSFAFCGQLFRVRT